MARKDSEKEADRPHYYSQFWLDVAAGRKVIGGGLKTDEADAETEAEAAELEPQEPVMHRSSRPATATIAPEEPVYAEPLAETEVEPEFEEAAEEFAAPELEEAFPLSEEEEFDHDQELPNILVDEETEVPDMDLADEDEEDFFDEEEEEGDDEEWGRGRKKPKPGRQTKQPPKPPVKRAKRDRRY